MKKVTLFATILLLTSVVANAQKIYKTPSGAKYHLGSCRMVQNVSEEISFERAAELGLQPCKICKPKDFTGLGLLLKKTKLKDNLKQCSAKELLKKGHDANT